MRHGVIPTKLNGFVGRAFVTNPASGASQSESGTSLSSPRTAAGDPVRPIATTAATTALVLMSSSLVDPSLGLEE